MKVLVTGGAGFIGSHVVDALIADGHTVVVADDLSSGRRENVHAGAAFVRADIRSSEMLPLFLRERFEAVIHHAAQMDVRRSVEDPLFDASVNISGSLNLLEACVKSGVKQFLFASTGGAIYGEQDYFPADERHPTRPLSPYGIGKLAVEKYLDYYRSVHGLQPVILRYANIYGPRQNPHGEAGVVAIFTSRMLSGGQPLINGDGTQTRDYTYVADVVRANLLALRRKSSGTFNVGTGRETDVNTLFRTLRDLTGSSCAEQHGPAKAGEQQRSVIDSALLEATFTWRPSTRLEDGLRQTVDYFRQRAH